MTTLRCVVERITYQNPENGYSVLKVKVKGYDDLVTLVGNLLEVPVGSVLLCRGEWKVDKRYGSQFVAATWEETMPATVYGIEKYLGSGLVKGIGPRFARAIVQRFGAATIEVIETDIERLYEVPQIGRKRVEKIRESWERQKEIKNVMLFLQSYGVSTAYAAKIYREYGSESIDKVRENPYRLCVSAYFEQMGVDENDLTITARLNDQESIKNLVAGGLGVSIISEKAAEDARDAGRLLTFVLPGDGAQRRLYAACRRGAPVNRQTRQFLDFVIGFYQ